MKTSSAKAKGRRACQELVELYLEAAPELEEGDFKVTSSGSTGEDVWKSPKAREIYPWADECKNQESLNIWSALAQAESHSKEYLGVVFFKRNRSKLYVALDAKEFLELVVKRRNASRT